MYSHDKMRENTSVIDFMQELRNRLLVLRFINDLNIPSNIDVIFLSINRVFSLKMQLMLVLLKLSIR